ncbi:nucleotidyltransferase domain-containing protein [uncultured Thiodictyon sp.]|uniref:nucleotidyltransferase domain-containing protein n=1 Tax=uncultured Thiodictyon sp. TaxID=1846217 RepID=UPI0025E4A9B0|nr:nucleotidyltransferase domain-containing protein [uncultured Thiodictyon sp.]
MNEHPIDPVIRSEIERQLTAIESAHAVRVLFACESGSRGWGFASPDSDYDVRFLYVHPLAWYLRVNPPRDVIELPISGVLDINGWELRKALGLLKKGNATLVEWLDSPVVYRADPKFLDAMRLAARLTHRPERSFYHYVHMARGNDHTYLRGEQVRLKKYLYVLRPLLAARWIEQGRGLAPMRFQDLVDALVTEPALRDAIAALLARKRAALESEYSAPLRVIDDFIAAELAHLGDAAIPVPRDIDFSVLDRLLLDTVTRLDRGD